MWAIVSATLSLLHYVAIVAGWIVVISIVLKITLGQEAFNALWQKLFAVIMVEVLQDYFAKVMGPMKDDLFSSMSTMKSADAELKSKNALNILEVGVGGGANLQYYPAGSRLVSVDPNVSFESYFRRSCGRQAAHLSDVQFVVGRGEYMPDVPDASVDAVVVTLVLCSADNLPGMLREMRRVLVPGGKLYLLEHMGDRRGSWRRRVQDLLTNCGLWPGLLDGCELNRRMMPVISEAGFSSVDMQEVAIQEKTGKMLPVETHGAGGFLLNPILYGTATK